MMQLLFVAGWFFMGALWQDNEQLLADVENGNIRDVIEVMEEVGPCVELVRLLQSM